MSAVICDPVERYIWTSNTGQEFELPVLAGAEGLASPPDRLDVRSVFGEDGERRIRQEHAAREIFLPVGLRTADCPPRQALRELIRTLACGVDTRRGTGVLRVELDGVSVREIEASLVEGMQITVDSTRVQTIGLTFRAHEPYWRAIDDTELFFATGEGVPFFRIDGGDPDPVLFQVQEPQSFLVSAGGPHLLGEPMPPFELSTAPPFGQLSAPGFQIGKPFPVFELSTTAIVASQTVDVACDVSVFPRWRLTGPASNVRLVNATTGAQILLPGVVLSPGEELHIDTRPGVKTVLNGDGDNVFPLLSPLSTLFELPPGPNQLILLVDGAVFPQTTLQLAYRERFLTF